MFARCLVIATALFSQLHGTARGQCAPAWVPGNGLPAGTVGWVNAATLWDPDGPGPAPAALVVGGPFTVPGPSPIEHLAVLDLATGAWSAVPGWTFGEVTSLIAMPNGDLVVAGWGGFGSSGQVVIARWNGSGWQPLGTANERVYAMAVASNGDLFVGGAFTFVNGLLLSGVARWDGANWSPLVSGLGGFAFALTMVTMPNGDLVVGGVFGPLGGTSSPGIARWDGTTWSTVGVGFGGTGGMINRLLVEPNGDLLAAGAFTNGIARWNGVAWTMLGSSPYFQSPFGPGPLAVLPDGDVLAGGYFAQTGSSPLLRWDGNAWTPLGASVSAQQLSAAVPGAFVALPDGDIAVAGQFDFAGSLPSIGVARLRTPCAATVAMQGPGCASSGGNNTLAARSLPWIGSTFRARGEGLPGLALVSTVYGLSPTTLPLGAVLPQAPPGCDLLVAPDFVIFAFATAGTVDTALPLPDSLALVGMQFYHQLNPFEIDASFHILAVTASNALRMQIGAW